MKNIRAMQDKIISVLGHEHPDTIYFFELCSHNDKSKSYYPKFLKHMLDSFITLNSPKLKHIQYCVHNLQSDTVVGIRCMEIDGAIDYTSLFRIIPTGNNEYITILDIITE